MRSPRRALALVAVALLPACGGDGDAYCDRLDELGRLDAAAALVDDRADEVARAQLADMTAGFRAVAEAAPDEVADDAFLVARWADDLVEIVAAPPSDDPLEVPAALSSLGDDYPGLDAALVRLLESARRECGFTPST